MVDPRGRGLLFFMFIRPQPYTCLGIEWLDPLGLTQGFVSCCGDERRDRPLKEGWSHNLPVGEGGDVEFCLVWCWRVSAWCWGMGVEEGYYCFLVVERFLEGRGKLELVVEGVDGDE